MDVERAHCILTLMFVVNSVLLFPYFFHSGFITNQDNFLSLLQERKPFIPFGELVHKFVSRDLEHYEIYKVRIILIVLIVLLPDMTNLLLLAVHV